MKSTTKPKKHNKTIIAYVAIVFHVEGLMSNNVGLLARIIETTLPGSATGYQCFYNGVLLLTQIAAERHLSTERVELLGCFKTRQEAQACCDLYLSACKQAAESAPPSISNIIVP